MQSRDRKLLCWLVLGVLGMFGFSYLLVPIYQLVCKQEGINGRGVRTATAVDTHMQVDTSRTLRVTFSTIVHEGLNFKFYPLKRTILIHPGERKLVYFYAQNQSGREMTVQAIPSITPVDAARYLKKTECFCFTRQYFFQGEKADMPVYFFIEPDIAKEVTEVTLSYTLFDAGAYVQKNESRYTKGRINL